ncbi:hypothetical protein F5Y04DRAFT_288294 [Hypomontagnella monticulosa]|nr:hypothetical protein F5Y04DRAFT_288294 [Hypomontagnella monticulosa]
MSSNSSSSKSSRTLSPTTLPSSSSPTVPSGSPLSKMAKSQPNVPLKPLKAVLPTESPDISDYNGGKRKRSKEDDPEDPPVATKRAKSARERPESEPSAAKKKTRGGKTTKVPQSVRNLKSGATKDNKGKPTQKDDSDQQPHFPKKSTIVENTRELESKIPKYNKRKRGELEEPAEDIRLVEPTEDIQLAKKPRLTVEELQEQLEAANDKLKATSDKLKEANRLLLKCSDVERKTLDHQLNRMGMKYNGDEDRLKLLFQELETNIGSFTCHKLVHIFKGETIPEQVERELEQVSQTPFRKFLETESHAPLFFQALIWRFLCNEFLDNPFKLWGKSDETGRVLADIHSGKFGGERDELNFWRLHTGQLLLERPIDGTRLQALKDRLLQLVTPFVTEENKESIGTEIEPSINEIVDIATKLARYINIYVGQWKVTRKGASDAHYVSQSYDDTWMRIDDTSLGDWDGIDLLISPAFIKRGTFEPSGKEYTYVAIKAEVCYQNGRRPVSRKNIDEKEAHSES